MTEQTIREQTFFIVFKNVQKMVMTLGCIFGEDDDSTEDFFNELKQAFAEGATFEIRCRRGILYLQKSGLKKALVVWFISKYSMEVKKNLSTLCALTMTTSTQVMLINSSELLQF